MVKLIFAVAMLCALGASLTPALGAYDPPRNQQLFYAVEMTQRFRPSAPWTGDLVIKINDEGIVNGQYRSNSIRPDPFRGQMILVSGGLNGEFIRLTLGTRGVTIRGTISSDKITGQFHGSQNTIYDFVALRVTQP